MAGGKQEVSMSALGHFYDALFANTQEQVKKYGRAGASDFVGADISDGIADAIVDVASTLTLSPQLADQFQANAVNYFNDKLTGGFGLNLTDIGILSDPKYISKTTWTTAARDDYGNVIGSNEEIVVAPKIEISNLNDLISDPKSVADAAADKFFGNWKAAMNARAIAGIGNKVQEWANSEQLKTIGVDSDIRATIVHARIGTEENFKIDPKLPNSSGEAVRDAVLANTFAMYGGAMTEVERSELSAHLLQRATPVSPHAGVFENATLKARAQATGGGANFAYWDGADPTKGPLSFTDLFIPQKNSVPGNKHDKSNILGQFNQATLFNLNPFTDATTGAINPTEGYGLLLKNSLQSAIQDSLGQPAVLANNRLRTNLMKLFSSFDDETKATNFFRELGNAGSGGYRDMSGAVKAGLDNLGSEFARTGNVVGAARMASASGTVGATNGEMKLGDWLSYMSYRTSAHGFLGSSGIAMSMLVFGDEGATKAFIDGVGAFNFSNILKPNAGSVEPKINGSYFMKYLGEADPAYNLFSAAESKQFSKYYFGYTNAAGETEDKKRLLGWAQLGWTIGPNASAMQKGAYLFHTYHPYNFVSGLLTGKTPQRMLVIGSGYNRYLTQPARWSNGARWASKLLKNKSYQTAMRFSSKIQGFMAIPGRMVRDATQKVAKIVFEKVIMKVAVKLGVQVAVQAVAATLTAGVSFLIYAAYYVINWLSGGLIDKAVKGTLRLTFEFLISVILWIVCSIIAVFVLIFAFLGFFPMMGMGYGGMLHPPDPGYEPQLRAEQEPPGPTGPPINPTPTITIPGGKGIDVSHHDDTIDWNTVKKDGKVEFAFIKATEGSNWPDHEFSANWKNSKAVGIPRAAYHFFIGSDDGEAQARYFLDIVDRNGGGEDFQLAIDVETPSILKPAPQNVAAQNLKEMLDYIENKRGYKPIIYTGKYVWTSMVGNPGWVKTDVYPLWLASYRSTTPTSADLPPGWTKWDIWQYTDNGSVPGIRTYVDLDVWAE